MPDHRRSARKSATCQRCRPDAQKGLDRSPLLRPPVNAPPGWPKAGVSRRRSPAGSICQQWNEDAPRRRRKVLLFVPVSVRAGTSPKTAGARSSTRGLTDAAINAGGCDGQLRRPTSRWFARRRSNTGAARRSSTRRPPRPSTRTAGVRRRGDHPRPRPASPNGKALHGLPSWCSTWAMRSYGCPSSRNVEASATTHALALRRVTRRPMAEHLGVNSREAVAALYRPRREAQVGCRRQPRSRSMQRLATTFGPPESEIGDTEFPGRNGSISPSVVDVTSISEAVRRNCCASVRQGPRVADRQPLGWRSVTMGRNRGTSMSSHSSRTTSGIDRTVEGRRELGRPSRAPAATEDVDTPSSGPRVASGWESRNALKGAVEGRRPAEALANADQPLRLLPRKDVFLRHAGPSRPQPNRPRLAASRSFSIVPRGTVYAGRRGAGHSAPPC